MKKVLFSIAAAALALTSCVKENVEVAQDYVTFEVAVEDVATRAIGDGSTCNKLVYEVYNAAGVKIAGLSKSIETKFPTTVKIQLAKGQTYSVAFWAQNSECTAYNTESLERVKINYDDVKGNEDSRDAFFAYVEPFTSTVIAKEVTLKRPFAQLNLAVSDLEAATAAGISLDEVKVVTNSAAALNVVTGKAEGETEVEFSSVKVLENESLTPQGSKDSYPWISMNYLLPVTGASRTNVNVEFTLTTNFAPITLTSLNTPIERNWRTNIIAKLTEENSFEVKIDPSIYGDINVDNGAEPEVYGVSAGSEYFQTIEAALNEGHNDIQIATGNYALTANVMSEIAKDRKVTITGVGDAVLNITENIRPLGTLTFNNVTVVTNNGNYVGISANGVTFNECTFENNYFCYGGTTVFNNCTFNQTSSDSYNVWTYNDNVDFNGCVFNCFGKSVLVYGERDNGTEWRTVNFTDCEFKAEAQSAGKAAIEIDSKSRKGYVNVNIKGCTAKGFANGSVSGNSLYNVKNGTEGVDCILNVELTDGVSIANGEYLISNAAGMFWFANEVNVNKNNFSGKTVKLVANIDLENRIWSPVGQTGSTLFGGTFDGNNMTISNLKSDVNAADYTHSSAGLFGWTEAGKEIKNLTIDGAIIKGHHYAGAIVAYNSCKVINCTVKNAVVSSTYDTAVLDNGDKAGAIAGYNNAGTLTNCHAVDCEIDAIRDAGQLVGASKAEYVADDCTATNVKVSHNDSAAGYTQNTEKDGQNIRNELIGNVLL